MDCITCNLEINNENYISCLCGNKYHYKCLYKAKIMKTNWSNKSPPKYAIQLFRSPNFTFKCNTCINNNNDNTPINQPSLNNSLPSSTIINNSNINTLINSRETKLNMLLSKITEISDMIVVKKSYANVTANVTSTVTNSDTFTDNLVKSVNIIKNNIDRNNEIIIHNINIPNNDKTNFFKYLVNIICKTVDINKSCVLSIVQLSFNKLKLILDNVVSKKIILSNVNRLCKLRDLQNSFIRTSLDEISLERHQILYHVVKNKLIKSKKIIKCIYNSRSSSYELRYIINNKIDWNMSIGEDNFSVWKLSYITYKKSIINKNKNKNTGSR